MLLSCITFRNSDLQDYLDDGARYKVTLATRGSAKST